jgi:16S rRNA (adenine1518-N6/adenine1519-N6)-dimethyltransferase
MIQKEVAERIAAPHGNKTYGILSVFLQTFYNIEYLFTVGEKVFDPPPKVKSAVIRLTRNERETLPCSEKLFFQVVKFGFNQRRKTLRNSIRSILPVGFESNYLNMRPEQLSIADFITLCQEIEKTGITS